MSTPDVFTGIVATSALRSFSSTAELETADTTTSGSHGLRFRKVVPQATTVNITHTIASGWARNETLQTFVTVASGDAFAIGSFPKHVIAGIGIDRAVAMGAPQPLGFTATATVPWPIPIAVQELTEILANAHAASATNDLRQAYREIFRALNRLFAQGNWVLAAVVLRALCAQPYPVSIGIGAVRFSSSVASHLSNWRNLIKQLEQRIVSEGKDPSEMLRGLEDGRSI